MSEKPVEEVEVAEQTPAGNRLVTGLETVSYAKKNCPVCHGVGHYRVVRMEGANPKSARGVRRVEVDEACGCALKRFRKANITKLDVVGDKLAWKGDGNKAG
jgi:hypothetical protein